MGGRLLEDVADRVKQHPKLIFADDFEITVESSRARTIRFQNGAPAAESRDDAFRVGLRVIHRKAPGSAVVSGSDSVSIDRLVESAFQSARGSTGDPWFRFPLWKKSVNEPRTVPLTLPESSLWIEDPALGFVEERYETWESDLILRRKTERHTLVGVRAVFSAVFSAAARCEGGVLLLREERSNRSGVAGFKESLATLSRDTAGYAAASAPELSGRGAVVIAPAVGARLAAALAGWFHADKLRRKRSPLTGQDPNHVFSPVLSLVDAGNHPESPYSVAFDDEGTLTRETFLIERGALRNLLFDTYEATRENRLSTGNFLRAPGATWPAIQPSTCFFRPADQSVEELLREAGRGVWVRRVESLEPVGETSSRFRLLGCGNLIENGAAGAPIRGIRLEFDAFELLRKAVGAGSDLELFGPYGSPSILFDKVPLS